MRCIPYSCTQPLWPPTPYVGCIVNYVSYICNKNYMRDTWPSAVLDKSAKVEWNYCSRRTADDTIYGTLERMTHRTHRGIRDTVVPARCLTGIHAAHDTDGGGT